MSRSNKQRGKISFPLYANIFFYCASFVLRGIWMGLSVRLVYMNVVLLISDTDSFSEMVINY